MTDNGPEFGAYNSRAQGIVKVGHHPFRKTLLKSWATPGEWSDKFHHALWVDRVAVRKATGFTPFYRAHGYDCLLLIEAYMLTFAMDARPMSMEALIGEWLRLLDRRAVDEEDALRRIAKSRWEYKERFEREHARTLFHGNPTTLIPHPKKKTKEKS